MRAPRPSPHGRAAQALVLSVAACLVPPPAHAQTLSARGFVEARSVYFPQRAPNDDVRVVGDILLREETFFEPKSWIQFAAGVDARANTYDQVDGRWRLDVRDRGSRRPAVSVRRLGATLVRGGLTVDLGKQFIRWGKADIVTPTDHLAPRDFLNVIDNEFLAVTGARGVAQRRSQTIEAVWIPWFTPSRTPLLDQRWTVVPAGGTPTSLTDGPASLPRGSQVAVRWGYTGDHYEASVSYFDGFNHLPNIDTARAQTPLEVQVLRRYPRLRSYGLDAAVPTPWCTIKGEVAYSTSSTPGTDEYAVYVVQVERTIGEWLLLGGYSGEVVTARRASLTFAPDRGLTRSVLARASYTIDTNQNAAVELALRQNGDGVYAKGEWSRAQGSRWRTTLTGVLVRGKGDDFLGQFRLNSHVAAAMRYSF